MSINLTRFYYDDIGEKTKNLLPGSQVVEDVETTEADEFENKLKNQGITYVRIDL